MFPSLLILENVKAKDFAPFTEEELRKIDEAATL